MRKKIPGPPRVHRTIRRSTAPHSAWHRARAKTLQRRQAWKPYPTMPARACRHRHRKVAHDSTCLAANLAAMADEEAHNWEAEVKAVKARRVERQGARRERLRSGAKPVASRWQGEGPAGTAPTWGKAGGKVGGAGGRRQALVVLGLTPLVSPTCACTNRRTHTFLTRRRDKHRSSRGLTSGPLGSNGQELRNLAPTAKATER